jgi:hypothetical protein
MQYAGHPPCCDSIVVDPRRTVRASVPRGPGHLSSRTVLRWRKRPIGRTILYYQLYKARGRADGHELKDWLQAEVETCSKVFHSPQNLLNRARLSGHRNRGEADRLDTDEKARGTARLTGSYFRINAGVERQGWAQTQRSSQTDRMEPHVPRCAIGFRITGAARFPTSSTSAWLKYWRRERDSNPRYP